MTERWFRHQFTIPAGATITSATIRIAVDDEVRIYLNDQHVATTPQWATVYEFDMTNEVQPGSNTLLLHVINYDCVINPQYQCTQIFYDGYGCASANCTKGDTPNPVGVIFVIEVVYDLPVDAVNDSYTTPEDTPLNVSVPGVLANDSYPDGLGSLNLWAPPNHGTVNLNQNGSFTYTPNPNFCGVDSFIYRLCDVDGDCDTATVTITVNGVNDTPTARNDSYTTNEDTTLTIAAPGVRGNDDLHGEGFGSLTVTDGVDHGALTLNQDGSFAYTPNPNWCGTDRFTYRLCDAGDCGTADCDTAVVTITVQPVDDQPALLVDKTGPAHASEGDTVTYTISVSHDLVNGDGSPIYNLTVTDSLGGPATYVSGDDGDGVLEAGETWVYQVDYTIPVGAPNPLVNTATASGVDVDGDPVEGSDSHSLRIEADLEITKQCHQVTAGVDDQLVYTIVVENEGPSDAREVVVSDALPVGLSDASWTLDGVDQGAWTGTANLGTLAAGDTAVIEIYADVASWVTSLANTATVTSSIADPDTADNDDTCTNQVEVEADVAVEKIDNPDPVIAGTQLAYTITVTNHGPSDASNVVVVDYYDEYFHPQSATPAPDRTYDDRWEWHVGTLGAGDSLIITLVGTVDSGAYEATLMNVVEVNSDTYDPDEGNNQDAEDTASYPEADVGIEKTDDPDPVIAGNRLTYTITVTNYGPSDTYDVEIRDTLPDGVTYVEDDCNGIWRDTYWEWEVTELPAGSSVSCRITVSVDQSLPEGSTLVNTVEIWDSPVDDPNGDNNSASETTDVITRADVSVEKADDPDPVVAGERITYTIVVTNGGPSDAQNVVVTETYPSWFHFESASPEPDPGTNNVWSLGTLGAYDWVTIEITGTVDPATPEGTQLLNTVVADSDTQDDYPDDNSDEEETDVITRADISVEKVDHPDPVVAGEEITYTITVTNHGPSDAQDVVVTETYDPWFHFESADPAPDQGADNRWTLGTLPAGASVTIEITGTVDPATPEGTQLLNTVVVDSDTQDDDEDDNSDEEETDVITRADLEITKESSPDPVIAGTQLTYTITVTNHGPSDAQNVVVTETYDPWFHFESADPAPDQGTDNRWTLGTLPAGASVTIEITGTVDPATPEGTQLLNTVVVDSDTQDDDEDDNSDEEETDVITRADLEITKESSPDPVIAGTQLTYTITVTNHGPSDAQNVVVTETYDPWFHFESADPAPDQGTDNRWTLGTLPAGASVTIEITGTVDPATPEGTQLLNTVVVDSDTQDDDEDDNSDEEETDVITRADLEITKESSPDPVIAGEELTYTITVTNHGPSDAQDVVVTETYDPWFHFESATPEPDPDTDNRWTFPVIPAGESISIQIIGRVDPAASEQLENVATVASDTIDPDEENNIAEEFTNLAALELDKVGNVAYADVGDTVYYTFLVTNPGEIDLEDVRLVDEKLGIEVVIPLLPARTTWEYTIGYTLGLEDIPELMNTAQAIARFGERELVVEDNWVVYVSYASGLSVLKETLDLEGNPILSAEPGQEIVYRFTVENTGDVPLSGVEVVDDVLGQIPGPSSGDLDGDAILDPGEAWVYEKRYLVTQEDAAAGVVENVAVASGENPWGTRVSAVATHTLDTREIAGLAGAAACEARVVITEVAWAGTPADSEDEWIELMNLSAQPVDLSGWVIRWRPKDPQTPEETRWRVVELRGVIPPCLVTPCVEEPRPWWTDFIVHTRESDGLVWLEFTAREELARREHGYFLLERRHDLAVRDRPADLVYDPEGTLGLDLPDQGAVIQLLNPAGEVVDTVNAFEGEGWPGGDAALSATLERVSPLAPDSPEGWDTNLGLKAFGQAADGSELLATPAGDNEGRLAWQALPEVPPHLQPVPLRQLARLELEMEPEAWTAGWPRLSLTRMDEGPVVGGFSYWRLGSRLVIELDPEALPPGEYRLWAVLSPGRAILVWFTVGTQ